MSQKIYLSILKTGIYLAFLPIFFVFGTFLFPYITSKQIPFNILVEVLLVFWVMFIIQYKEWRPKKSWISIGLVLFFATLLTSCFTGVDFHLSFWGDAERMLGVFHLLHFLAFYFILITVFREKKDWKNFLIVSLVVSVLISLNGLAKNIQYSAIGNTAYLSGYLIFNMYFAFLLFFQEKNKSLRWIYLCALPILFLAFQKAGTTGAYVGLGFSIVVALFLYAVLNKNKKIRLWTLILAVLFIIIIGGLFINKDKNFIKYNPAFQVIREVDFQKNTFQTRLISWRAALKDFKEHPILGVGHGNYAVIFDKYFEPTFYDYTRSETYFDRAHNNIIDIGSTSGALGLLTYLSIFFAVAGYLIRAYRKDRITIHEFILLTSLIIAYFTQNLAVFDSFTTYLSLMITLGFIYYLVNKEKEIKYSGDKEFRNIDLFIFLILIIAMSTVLFKYSVRPIQMLRGVIYGQIAFSQEGYLEKGFEIYKNGLSYNTPLDRDGRDSLTRVIISDFPLNKVGYEKAEEILEYTIDMANKNIEYNPQDALMHTDLSQLYGVAADFYNGKDEEKFIYYSDKSLEEINKAIEISPMRIPVYFVKSYFYSVRDEKDKAIETIEYATTLNDKYYDSFCHLARYYFMDKQNFKGFENMDKCLDLGGQDLLVSEGYVRNMIEYYTDKDDTYKLIKLYDRLTKIKPIEPKPWLRLASLYGKVGDMENLLIVSEKAVKIDPTLRDNMDAIIQITKDNAWAEVEKEAEGKVESEE